LIIVVSDRGATAMKPKGGKSCEVKSHTGISYDSKPPDWSSDLRVTWSS